jgi:hypothetical protein
MNRHKPLGFGAARLGGLIGAIMMLLSTPAKADWIQSFTFSSTGIGLTSFDVTNLATVSTGGSLTPLAASLTAFTDPSWSWSYIFPASVDPESNLRANGGPDSTLTFDLDFTTDPTVPSEFQFNAFGGGNPFVLIGGADLLWNGAGTWAVTQYESDVPIPDLTPVPEPASYQLLLMILVTAVATAASPRLRRRIA